MPDPKKPITPNFGHNRYQQALCAAFIIIWIVTSIAPFDRFDWFLENILVFAFALYVITTYRSAPLSNVSYLLITVFMALHALGSHYTYSEMPLGKWLQHAFDMERNHYDRVVHFLFGLLMTYPVFEQISRWSRREGLLASIIALALIMACGGVYEIMEWAVAEIVSPDAAMAYLGTQGDVFDAQKDAVLAALGSIMALGAIALTRRAGRTAD